MADKTERRQSPPDISEAIGGLLSAWEGDRLVIAYDFPCGVHRIKLVEANDLPVIRRLAQEGKLCCSNDRVCELFARQERPDDK
jgi:hypothetical protein